MLNDLLHKLIKTGEGRGRFVLAIVGLAIAMVLILSAVQLQANYNELLYGNANQDSIANFLVINKPVTGKSKQTTALTAEEIKDLNSQSFVQAAGVLTPSRFKVSASGGSHLPFYTDLFFESVRDEFIDVSKDAWHWDENANFIPMVVPHMFLDMYNFGFAASQNLPQLSPELVMSLPIQINIASPAGVVHYYAKVVGFSDRISSVLVPQTFMDWANNKFGSATGEQPSRIVIKTKDAGNPQLLSYLEKNGLQTDAEKTRFSRYRQVVSVIVNVSWLMGAFMFLFALLVFTLFIQLTVASSKEDIALLITLGASPKQLKRFLLKQFFPAQSLVILFAFVLVCVLQILLQSILAKESIQISAFPSFFTLLAAGLVAGVLWIVNVRSVRKYISQTG